MQYMFSSPEPLDAEANAIPEALKGASVQPAVAQPYQDKVSPSNDASLTRVPGPAGGTPHQSLAQEAHRVPEQKGPPPIPRQPCDRDKVKRTQILTDPEVQKERPDAEQIVAAFVSLMTAWDTPRDPEGNARRALENIRTATDPALISGYMKEHQSWIGEAAQAQKHAYDQKAQKLWEDSKPLLRPLLQAGERAIERARQRIAQAEAEFFAKIGGIAPQPTVFRDHLDGLAEELAHLAHFGQNPNPNAATHRANRETFDSLIGWFRS